MTQLPNQKRHSPIPPRGQSRVLLKQWSAQHSMYIPVAITHQENGKLTMDCPEGDHKRKAMARAREVLAKWGFVVREDEVKERRR
ncbi:MAG: hypothetical protein ACXABY_21250 [Candidatus Thorarchaeota archaeon]